MDSLLNDAGLFALRAGLAYVYLYGAWMIAGSSERRRLTGERSLVLCRGSRWEANASAGRILAALATTFMVIGGLGILLGIATRQAAVLLILFTLPGTIVHLREVAQSGELCDAVAVHAGSAPASAIAKLKWSGYAGHRSSANKNWALIGATLFLALAIDPNGRFSLSSLLGL